jgi:hypothetical protein
VLADDFPILHQTMVKHQMPFKFDKSATEYDSASCRDCLRDVLKEPTTARSRKK